VHDPVFVRLGDGVARLEHELDRELGREGSALDEDALEIPSLEELHHHEGEPVRQRPDVEDARGVTALQADGDPCFAQEAGTGVLLLPRALREKDLGATG
jgi:hypothetical protein